VDLKGEALLCARAAYYGLINHIDDQLRRILNSVTGLTFRDTLVVLTSDHGEMLGDHYLWRKSRAYEASARVPFLMAGPEHLGFGRGRRCDAVATHADIMPTILEAAGAPVPDTVDGRSLLPLVQGRSTEWRDDLHIEHAPHQHALTDGRWKYIWEVASGREQLFDLSADPDECRDLSGEDGAKETLADWRDRLVRRLEGRPEGFTDGESLVPGRPYGSALPHAGTPQQPHRKRFI
jgi:arylsulfatase A-like enzyme